jgi:cobalt-zinc-cadmium efflux system outer membrane protein
MKNRITLFPDFKKLLIFAVCGLTNGLSQPVSTPKDTITLTLATAEQRFLQNNLQLLASKLHIEATRAVKTQAEVWSNPNFAYEQNIYNQYTGKWFDITSSGNSEIQIQQLFLLAGKRDKQIKLAETNTAIAEYTLSDLMRALKLELRSDMFNLYFLNQSLSFYNESLDTLRRTVSTVELMYQKRSVLLADVLRLKSLQLTLETERQGIVNQINTVQGDLRVLLNDTTGTTFDPQIDESQMDIAFLEPLSLNDALITAREHRPDYHIAKANVDFEMTNLSYQHALAVPDLTIGGRWSRAGSYIPDYYAISLSIDLPIFNRNQGNVEISERTLEANKLILNNTALSLKEDILAAYTKASDADHRYRQSDKQFISEYKMLIDGVVANYKNRNISLLEFTDFYESYRTSMIQWHQLRNDRVQALEKLNFVVGADVVHTQN